MTVDPRLALHLDLAGVSDAEYVVRVYRLLVRRDPLPEDVERCVAALGRGTLSRATLLHELATSEEFARVRALDDAIARARDARLRGERPRLLTGPAGSDKRVIEIPWVLARYGGEPRVLDVGYAFAEPAYLAALSSLGAAELVGVDLAEADAPGLRSVVADVRELPFPDGSFDIVFCISTLEHVGQDTSAYGVDAHGAGGPEAALLELKRVLAPAGRLLVTVPCGQPATYGSFVQDEPAGWRRLFEQAGLFVYEEEVYELAPEGWRTAPDFDPEGVRYGERGPAASAVLCSELRPGQLRQAARRAGGRALRALGRSASK